MFFSHIFLWLLRKKNWSTKAFPWGCTLCSYNAALFLVSPFLYLQWCNCVPKWLEWTLKEKTCHIGQNWENQCDTLFPIFNGHLPLHSSLSLPPLNWGGSRQAVCFSLIYIASFNQDSENTMHPRPQPHHTGDPIAQWLLISVGDAIKILIIYYMFKVGLSGIAHYHRRKWDLYTPFKVAVCSQQTPPILQSCFLTLEKLSETFRQITKLPHSVE